MIVNVSRSGFAAKSYRARGIILRTQKLGEADRIITLLSPELGVIRAAAKGVRRTRSKMGATLEPFMEVDAQILVGKSLHTITQAQLRNPYGQKLVADYAAYTAAHAMVETAERLTDSEADTIAAQYRLLHGAIAALTRGELEPGTVLDSYLLRALATAGWAPSFTHCVRCGVEGPHQAINIPLGGVVCHDCRPAGSLSPSAQTVRLLAALLEGDWDTVKASDINARGQAGNIVAAYLQWHLERAVKSLKIVERR